MEVCVVRNDVDEFGRYLRFLDVAERWKRRPDGAEEWVQAGKLRDQVLLELEGIYREWFGELPLETLFLGEFDASSGPRPVAQVVCSFLSLCLQLLGVQESIEKPWLHLSLQVQRDQRSDDSGDRERLRELVYPVPFFCSPLHWSLPVSMQEELLDVGVPPSEEDARTDVHGNGMFLRRLALLMQHRVKLRARWSSLVWKERRDLLSNGKKRARKMVCGFPFLSSCLIVERCYADTPWVLWLVVDILGTRQAAGPGRRDGAHSST